MSALEDLKIDIAGARDSAERFAKKAGWPVVQSRGLGAVVLDKDGQEVERFFTGEFKLTKKNVVELWQHEGAAEVWIDGGFNGADSVRDMADGYHEPYVAEYSLKIDRNLQVLVVDSTAI